MPRRAKKTIEREKSLAKKRHERQARRAYEIREARRETRREAQFSGEGPVYSFQISFYINENHPSAEPYQMFAGGRTITYQGERYIRWARGGEIMLEGPINLMGRQAPMEVITLLSDIDQAERMVSLLSEFGGYRNLENRLEALKSYIGKHSAHILMEIHNFHRIPTEGSGASCIVNRKVGRTWVKRPFSEHCLQGVEEYKDPYIRSLNTTLDCWPKAIMEATREKWSQNYKRAGELTIGKIYEILGWCGASGQHDGLSFMEILPFFKQERIGCYIVDRCHRLLCVYLPSRNRKGKTMPRSLVFMYCGNHCVWLDHETHSLIRDLSNKVKDLNTFKEDADGKILVAPKDLYLKGGETIFHKDFHIPTPKQPADEEEETKMVLRQVSDLKSFLDGYDRSNPIDTHITWDGIPLIDLALKIREWDLDPKIEMVNGAISAINILMASRYVPKQEKHRLYCVKIRTVMEMCGRRLENIGSQDDLDRFYEARTEFRSGIIQAFNLSSYHPSVMEVFRTLKRGGVQGILRTVPEHAKTFTCLDFNKCYPSIMLGLDKLPVISPLDTFVKYDGSELQDFTLYIVKKIGDAVEYPMRRHTLCYGKNLKRCGHNRFEVLEQLKCSGLRPSKYKDHLEKLWSSGIDREHKKFIANELNGSLGQDRSEHNSGFLYGTGKEAYDALEISGGKMVCFSGHLSEDEAYLKDLYDMLWNEKAEEGVDFEMTDDEDNEVWMVCDQKRFVYKSGFFPIHHYVIDTAEAMWWSLVDDLKSVGIEVLYGHTDGVHFVRDDARLQDFMEKFPQYFKAGAGLLGDFGKLKIEHHDKPCQYTRIMRVVENRIDPKEPQEIVEITMKDERSLDEVMEIKRDHKRLLTLGSVPGSGKSYFSVIGEDRAKTLVVCPYNAGRQEFSRKGWNAITVSKCFGERVGEIENHKIQWFDVRDYDLIVCEEVWLWSDFQLASLSVLMERNEGKRFILNGDPLQLRAVGEEGSLNQLSVEQARDRKTRYISGLCGSVLTLRENKRCSGYDDFYSALRSCVVSNDLKRMISLMMSEMKVISSVAEITDKLCISYTHQGVNRLNEHIAGMLGVDTQNPVVGQEYVCCNHFSWNSKSKDYAHVNVLYRCVGVDGNRVSMSDEDGAERSISLKMFKSNFKLGFCRTGHSYQGLTVENDYTIDLSDMRFISAEWLWVALTRTSDLAKVSLLVSEKERAWRAQPLEVAVTKKIRGYIRTDKTKGYAWNKADYVDLDWVLYNLPYGCARCRADLNCGGTYGFVVDRVCTNGPHVKSNCRLLCAGCNVLDFHQRRVA